MRRLGLAALCAVGIVTAAPVEAAVMRAAAQGDFNDLDPGLTGWTGVLIYDTAGGQIAPTATGQALHWDSSMGAPSPFLEFSGEVQGTLGAAFDITQVTDFDLVRDLTNYAFSFTLADGGKISFGYQDWYGFHDPAGTDLSLTAPYTHVGLGDANLYGVPNCICAFGYTESLSVAPAGLPEPASWALMIGGFFGIGAALRQGRLLGHPRHIERPAPEVVVA